MSKSGPWCSFAPLCHFTVHECCVLNAMFRVTGPLWMESAGDACDLRRYCVLYEVIAMYTVGFFPSLVYWIKLCYLITRFSEIMQRPVYNALSDQLPIFTYRKYIGICRCDIISRRSRVCSWKLPYFIAFFAIDIFNMFPLSYPSLYDINWLCDDSALQIWIPSAW